MEKTDDDIALRIKDAPVLFDAGESEKTLKEEVAPRLDYLQHDEGSNEADSDEELLDIAWKYKWLALLCVCAFPLGQNCERFLALDTIRGEALGLAFGVSGTDSALGPLKATLRTELKIDNTQYGRAQLNKIFHGTMLTTLLCRPRCYRRVS